MSMLDEVRLVFLIHNWQWHQSPDKHTPAYPCPNVPTACTHRKYLVPKLNSLRHFKAWCSGQPEAAESAASAVSPSLCPIVCAVCITKYMIWFICGQRRGLPPVKPLVLVPSCSSISKKDLVTYISMSIWSRCTFFQPLAAYELVERIVRASFMTRNARHVT